MVISFSVHHCLLLALQDESNQAQLVKELGDAKEMVSVVV